MKIKTAVKKIAQLASRPLPAVSVFRVTRNNRWGQSTIPAGWECVIHRQWTSETHRGKTLQKLIDNTPDAHCATGEIPIII